MEFSHEDSRRSASRPSRSSRLARRRTAVIPSGSWTPTAARVHFASTAPSTRRAHRDRADRSGRPDLPTGRRRDGDAQLQDPPSIASVHEGSLPRWHRRLDGPGRPTSSTLGDVSSRRCVRSRRAAGRHPTSTRSPISREIVQGLGVEFMLTVFMKRLPSCCWSAFLTLGLPHRHRGGAVGTAGARDGVHRHVAVGLRPRTASRSVRSSSRSGCWSTTPSSRSR